MNMNDETNDIVKMVTYKDEVAANNPPKKVGKVLGNIFTKVFNIQVPDVEYTSYWSKTIISDEWAGISHD